LTLIKTGKNMNIRGTRKPPIQPYSFLLLLTFFAAACSNNGNSMTAPAKTAGPAATSIDEIQVIITEGHDTDPQDGGRPVVLIAAALGVSSEEFREAFRHVQPAGAGTEPDPTQVKKNKSALLSALGRYGITNDFLDTVSNYYRFNGSSGETWPQTPAAATAIVTDGVVSGFRVTNPGSGYTSAPLITISGSDVKATAILSFSKDFDANGSLAAIVIQP
jgi:hypothetical protein